MTNVSIGLTEKDSYEIIGILWEIKHIVQHVLK